MVGKPIDQARLKDIVKKRLFQVPPEMKRRLPPILNKPDVTFYAIFTDTYFILDFVDSTEKERIQKLMEKGRDPFPALIKPDNISAPTSFRFERSKNIVIGSCVVKNAFSFSLGKDCTLILYDHKISIQTEESGVYEYVINLAYIVSFGDEINIDNYYDFVEDLIAYSLKHWQEREG